MNRLLLLSLGLLPAVLPAANPIRNASFELGDADWGVVRSTRSDVIFRQPVRDAENPVHGRCSLRFDNPNADTVELFAAEIKLEKGKKYTLSWYARSSEPVRFRGAMVSVNGADWSVPAAFATLTPEWKRYQCTFTTTFDGSHIPKFIWGNWDKVPSRGTVWIDAVQLDEGSAPAAFAPHSQIECALRLADRVTLDRKPLTTVLEAVNHGDAPASVTAALLLEETESPERTTPLPSLTLNLPPKAGTSVKIPVAVGRFGLFRLKEANALCRPATFAAVPAPYAGRVNFRQDRTVGLEYGFGASSSGQAGMTHFRALPVDLSEHLEFFRKCGIRLLRVGNYGSAFSWSEIEPEPGRFDWSETDRNLDLARKHGFGVMPVLGNMFYLRDRPWGKRAWTRLPRFVVDNAEIHLSPKERWDGVMPRESDWRQYVAAFAGHFRNRVIGYELTNEPNIVIPAERYAEYVKQAAGEIRKADPTALIVGGCVTTDYGGRSERFITVLRESGALDLCDVLSFHPYQSRLDSSPEPAAKNLDDLKRLGNGKTLWNSELYYLWDPPAKERHNEYVLYPGTRPGHLFRRLCIDFGEGVVQSMPLNSMQLQSSDLAPDWNSSPGFVQAEPVPGALYPAYASAAHLFTGCKPLGRKEAAKGVTLYHFTHRDGSRFAVCWRQENAAPVRLSVPSSVRVEDLFGNPLPKKEPLSLTETPVVLRFSVREEPLQFLPAEFRQIP